MYQEGCPSINVALEQTHPFFRCVPRLHHDVVQLIAKKIVHYGFILVIYFEEVSKHAGGRQSAFE